MNLVVRRREVSPLILAIVTSVYFAIFCNAAFWSAIVDSRPLSAPATWLLIATTFLLIVALSLLLLLPFAWPRIVKGAVALLLVTNAVALHFMSSFHVVLDSRMLRNAAETDAKEVADLLSFPLFRSLLVYAVIPGIALVWVRVRREPFARSLRNALAAACIALAVIGVSGLASFRTYTAFFQKSPEAKHLVVPANYVTASMELVAKAARRPRGPRHPLGADATLGPRWEAPKKPVLFVLVVGETARAQQFSLNGYGRDTNPLLAQRDVINFRDVVACGTSTAESLPCMFSPLGRDHFSPEAARSSESLLDVVERSGVRVTWLDNNSGCKGICAGVESERLDAAADPDFCDDGECFDEILLEGFDARIVAGENRLIVLHQKGSHGPAYFRRYPKRFERFTPACDSDDFERCTQESILNAYDNSILYTDYILGTLVDRLAAITTHDTALLYISDHGESLGERGLFLHGLPYSIAPDTQTHVPMVLWMSAGFQRRLPVDRATLVAEAAQPLSHDNLFHSILGALDVRTSVYRPGLDVFAHSPTVKAGG
ncbi:MAG: phosphoethanolamine transferase [Thermoanaerobaculia bacterium]